MKLVQYSIHNRRRYGIIKENTGIIDLFLRLGTDIRPSNPCWKIMPCRKPQHFGMTIRITIFRLYRFFPSLMSLGKLFAQV